MIKEKYQFKKFLTYSHIAHGISTNAYGSMKHVDDGQIDRVALSKFAHTVGSSDDVVVMQQIHSGNVSIVTHTQQKRISETDGLITNQKNIPLAVLTADCLPIMFYDPVKKIVGIAHAGYRGLLLHIIEHMIDKFTKEFGSDPDDIQVGIGPCIETMCYEVGKEVIDKFTKAFPKYKNMYITKEGKFYLDLKQIALQSLNKKGILDVHIEIMDICTKCDEQFYSYRGGDGDKRFASLISLV
ncbi:MAG TPA: peptidoglycan editing factor PgeF [Candidatus Saccharimonadales bacterium]|nr:peptidoglycan editing factor PgeF [Candidatus Saccharimonadales bacterium]